LNPVSKGRGAVNPFVAAPKDTITREASLAAGRTDLIPKLGLKLEVIIYSCPLNFFRRQSWIVITLVCRPLWKILRRSIYPYLKAPIGRDY
jgi:hypothetical protein